MLKKTDGLLRPELVLEQLEIRDNMQVADFGCGHGHFSIPLAKMIPQGKIYALDVVKEALEVVNSQAELEGISNIETVRCNLEILGSSRLADNSIDLALLRNILFQSQKKSAILKEAKRTLKQESQLVLIEWIPESSLAPKKGWLISKEEAGQLVRAEGMILVKELSIDNQHYGLVFKK